MALKQQNTPPSPPTARPSVDPDNRVVMHCHPTHSLWEMCTECIVVFPDGVGALPRINTIRDDQMVELAEFFGVKYRKDFLNI